MSNDMNYNDLQKACEHLTRKATNKALSLQSHIRITVQKDSVDIATNADIECEKLIIDYIRQNFPDHNIHSEEAGDIKKKSYFTWIIDPIDGTKEFARGSKRFACLIAVEKSGEIVAGASCRADSGIVTSASSGNGFFENNNKRSVSKTDSLVLSLVGVDFLKHSDEGNKIMKDAQMKVIDEVINTVYRIRPTWDDCLLLGDVACGYIDAQLIMPLRAKWHDVAPGLLFVKEAGGTITDFKGNNIKSGDLSRGVVASNGKLHEPLLAIVSKYLDN